MHKKELIVLDATLLNAIRSAVFWAKLETGHQFVAVARPEMEADGPFGEGDRVTVEFSPFDLSTGYVLGRTPGSAR